MSEAEDGDEPLVLEWPQEYVEEAGEEEAGEEEEEEYQPRRSIRQLEQEQPNYLMSETDSDDDDSEYGSQSQSSSSEDDDDDEGDSEFESDDENHSSTSADDDEDDEDDEDDTENELKPANLAIYVVNDYDPDSGENLNVERWVDKFGVIQEEKASDEANRQRYQQYYEHEDEDDDEDDDDDDDEEDEDDDDGVEIVETIETLPSLPSLPLTIRERTLNNADFIHLIREIAQDFKTDLRITIGAAEIIRVAVEDYGQQLFEIAAITAGDAPVTPTHLQNAAKIVKLSTRDVRIAGGEGIPPHPHFRNKSALLEHLQETERRLARAKSDARRLLADNLSKARQISLQVGQLDDAHSAQRAAEEARDRAEKQRIAAENEIAEMNQSLTCGVCKTTRVDSGQGVFLNCGNGHVVCEICSKRLANDPRCPYCRKRVFIATDEVGDSKRCRWQ